MKILITKISFVLLLAITLIGCDSHPSLQKYYVNNQGTSNFIAVDIPASIVSLKDADASDEVKETLKTIKKINFLGFQLKEDNVEEYNIEKQKVKEILKNPKYQELIRTSFDGKSLTIKYTGEEDAIDEVILYGYDKELGFALVRVLGDKMDPSKMVELAQEIQVNSDNNASLNQIESFLKDIQ